MMNEQPTPDPELNQMLCEFVSSAQSTLGSNFLAAWLLGSFAVGEWDIDSDVDFLIIIQHELSDADLAALHEMHGRIYDLETHWAQHLDGSYFPVALLRREDPAKTPLWYLDNTSCVLVSSSHDNTMVVRWAAREYGIALAGPPPAALIDPVPPDDLRREVLANMRRWADIIFADPEEMNNRWYQPYAVLSYCRMLQTLQTGRICSKPAGARWATRALDPQWADLIERARQERPDPSAKVRQKADPADLARTQEFIRYALEKGVEIMEEREHRPK